MAPFLIPTFFCPKAWAGMSGDDTRRFCSYCKQHVHNLEAMNVNERLALLSSPAASICARYKIAIRRPAKGKEESYRRHMMKYGTGVAITSSALIVLCEMYAADEKRTYYRAIAGTPRSELVHGTGCGWVDDDWPCHTFEQHEVTTLGIQMTFPRPTEIARAGPGGPATVPAHVDLDLDPVEIDRLIRQIKPTVIELKAVEPLKDKKAGKRRLRGWGI